MKQRHYVTRYPCSSGSSAAIFSPVTKMPKPLSLDSSPTYLAPRPSLRTLLRHTCVQMNEKLPPRGGPNSPEGKSISSQNATNHGMCQERFFLLPGESQEKFDALRETWRKQYHLNEPAVPELVETLVERDWMQQRCTRNICKLEMQLAEAEAAENDDRIDRIERRLNNAYRYKTAAENSFQRALRALEQFRAVRKREELTKHRLAVRERQVAFNIAYGYAKRGLPLPDFIKKDSNNGPRPANS